MARLLPWQRSDCGLRARVPKDVHTINIIRLTRDRRVKDAGEDAVMRVGAGGTRLRGGRRFKVAVAGVGLLCTRLDLQFMKMKFAIAILTNFISNSSQFSVRSFHAQLPEHLLSRRLAAPAPLSDPPSAVPHLANCRIMFYIAVDNNANKSTIQRIQATNRQNKKAPNDDDEKLLKMSSFVWRHILDEDGPGVALTL